MDTASFNASGSCLARRRTSSKDRFTRRSIGSSSAAPVSSKWEVNEADRRANFYTLTRAGRKQLTVEEESWDLLALAIAKVREAT